ncbi:MAG: hypothetical protein RL264_1066 [Bacteroidota bacterium]|jgi:ParB family chromosome partitioning protein
MSTNNKKPSALGRGLGALLQNSSDVTSSTGVNIGSIAMLSVSTIEANPFNPRTNFDVEALKDLSNSIKIHGVIQPLTVRKQGVDKYQLISGERRFRAAQLAGLKEVPAYVRVANDQTMLEMALVENIQREDLNAIEVALSYQRLIEECKLTQEQLSEKVAKSRSNIANYLRLLKLPDAIQAGVRDNLISMGHARALLSIATVDEQLKAFEMIKNEQLSVRDVEQLAKGVPADSTGGLPAEKGTLSKEQEQFKKHLADFFAAKVSLEKTTKGNGKLVVHFKNEKELDRIMTLLNRP